MAMIKLATVRIIMNSSYVLINTTPSARLGIGGMRALPAALVSVLYCQGGPALLKQHREYYLRHLRLHKGIDRY